MSPRPPWPGPPVRNPAVALRQESDDRAVLFDPDTGAEVAVNPVGVEVWRLLDGRRELDDLVAEVRTRFDAVPATVAQEIDAFVTDLASRALARIGANRGGGPASPTGADVAPAAGLARTPRSITIEITSRCNLRCRYCYYFGNPAVTYRDLPTEEWLRFFAELGLGAVMRVCLAGGEPFLREDFPALVDGIVRNRMRFSVLSNGGPIDDAAAARLAATGRCDSVQVSIDGARAETHDAARGPGAFAAALRGIGVLQRHGVPVTARVTVHRHNVHELDEIARLLLVDLGLNDFSTNSAGNLGACHLDAQELLLDAAERQEAVASLERLAAAHPGRITAAAGPLAEAHSWRAMERARAAGAAPFPHGGRLTACGCPFEEIAVRADGVMVPCSMLAHVELGRINHDRLVDVWCDSPALARLRQRSRIALEQFECCAGCHYVPYCTGNCPATAYAVVGEVDHPSPEGCLRRFLAEGGLLPP